MDRLFNLIMQQAARQPVVQFVPPPIVITQQPGGFTGLSGAAFQIKVTSNGTAYAFYKDSTLHSQNNTGVLSFGSAAVSDSGNYYCIITDDYGQSLTSVTVSVTITQTETTPTPNPDPEPQPTGNGIWYVGTLTNGKIYTNQALAGNAYEVYYTGECRFLNNAEYINSTAGGFTLKQALNVGSALVVFLTNAAFISANSLAAGKTYGNAALAGIGYAVYRKGVNRLLALPEYLNNTAGGFTLKQALSNNADGLIIFASAIITSSLTNHKTYIDTALAGKAFLVYREGTQRFLESYEYLPLGSGGFTLKQAIAVNERLLIFKL